MIRIVARTSQALIDLTTLSIAFWLAFLLRLEGDLPLYMLKRLVFTWPYVVAFQYFVLVAFGIPRFAWRYVGMREAVRIVGALSAAGAALLAVRLLGGWLRPSFGYAIYAMVPIGVIVIDMVLAIVGIGGVRGARRWLGERFESQRLRNKGARAKAVPTILIGAGQAGLMVAKEIAARPDLGIEPLGFLDDDRMKIGTSVYGLRVLGDTADVGHSCARLGAKQAIVTIANAPGHFIRRITHSCEKVGVPVKIIPGIYEIVGDRVNLRRIRDVTIEDLLRRDEVVLDDELIGAGLRGKVVMVTGAGGSIGSELCRQICRYSPKRLVLLEQAENALYQIHRELEKRFPEIPLTPCIADICDSKRLEQVFDQWRPAYVVHAAAHKHVPMMEWNPGEAVKNNVFGTRKVADFTHEYGVERFVMISTDKAVNPTSVMGASKRVAEIYVQALSQKSKTRFVTVRFGNVLGSAGSVVPLFREQIAAGGPVTVTHPDMRRYFMTIPEACQLVLQAGAMGEGGEIFVLDMGEPVKVLDLAKDLIRLSGLQPDEIEIVFTGLRPGEKLFEELSVAEESATKTRHPKVFIGHMRPQALDEVDRKLKRLHQVVSDAACPAEVREALQVIVPEYAPAQVADERDSAGDLPARAVG